MNEMKLYVCEYCNTSYSHKSKALECERNHKKPLRVEGNKYHAIGVDSTGYPTTVVVKMADERLIEYKRC